MRLKPLGVVKEIVEAAGMGISYVYDDLVFIDHNALLLQFAGNDWEILIHINQEASGLELRAVSASQAAGRSLLQGDDLQAREALPDIPG